MSASPQNPRKPSDDATMAQGVPTSAPPATSHAPSSGLPVIQIEGYRIIHEISRGGQAVVYCAQFLKTGRRVAVKVMREGPLATEGGRARFTREAQILASLNHPNIVTILDRGQSADGSEYFSMDYIEGQALDDGTWKTPKYMELVNPDPSGPLKLFLKICDAVNAAHLRGIVHRDLKPSNIRLDERGEPHVLDFGLARGSMNEELAGTSEPVTITGQFLGSLPWASPEQAEGIGQKIDMRSDVYSLGVILYQLITGGTFPYQVVGSMRDVLNNIMTAQPPPPSEILSHRESRDVARRLKRIGPNHKLINPALDSIILKALAKRRDDRYQSAGELARDIEAYLAGRPLQAGGIVKSGTQTKFLIAVAAAAAILVGGTIAATMMLMNRSDQSNIVKVDGPATSPPTVNSSVSSTPTLPAIVASSPFKQEYIEIETIMNRFMSISSYLHNNAPSRFSTWLAAADKGDAVAQMLVARCYELGEGTAPNRPQSVLYLQKAVDQKLPLAVCFMGIRFRASRPPLQNFTEAMQWYKKAADLGNARAMVDLGVMYNQGQGTAQDTQAAVMWLQKGVDLGAPAACAFLGDIYRIRSNGVTDPSRSLALLKQAIDGGAPNGYFILGMVYRNGNGVARDFEEAMRLFQKADAEGILSAADQIGDMYAAGQGVKQDYQQSAQWYQKAANNGVAVSMRKLAAQYEAGNGLPVDRDKANAWYTKAAAAGDAEAQKWLSVGPAATQTITK